MSVNFSFSTFPRSLAFEFLRAGYKVHMATTGLNGNLAPCILSISLVTAKIRYDYVITIKSTMSALRW